MKNVLLAWAMCAVSLAAQDRVRAIQAPATPLPSEAASKGVTRFSFLVYGDTRSGVPPADANKSRDGEILQVEHAAIVESMLGTIKGLRGTPDAVRFVIQSGDAVARGQQAAHWNVSYIPLIDRLTQEGNVPYFLAAGNHDVTGAVTQAAPGRQDALRNTLDAIANLIPPEGSPRRLAGYPTYAFGFGNSFFLTLDSNLIGDDTQLAWVKAQLAGLDRRRFRHVFVDFHQNVFSSGRHGGARVEAATLEMRNRYMPLFRQFHVDAVLSGHEHLMDHFIEFYRDETGEHRMDLVTSGGGGAPTMVYTAEPDTSVYVQQNTDKQVRLEHLSRPGREVAQNPNHYLLIRVDGDSVELEVIALGMPDFQPYGAKRITLGRAR